MNTAVSTALQQTTDALTADATIARGEVIATGELGGACQVEVNVSEQTITFDMPAPLGGTNLAPNPGQYALATLGACQAITYRIWSEKLGVRLDAVHVDVRGQVDVRGLLGVDDGARPGFSHIDVDVDVRGPELAERYEDLRRAVDEHCPILDVFAAPVPVLTALTVVATEEA